MYIIVYGNGELNILSHPASIQFKGHDHLRESILPEIYSAALGFSTEQVLIHLYTLILQIHTLMFL